MRWILFVVLVFYIMGMSHAAHPSGELSPSWETTLWFSRLPDRLGRLVPQLNQQEVRRKLGPALQSGGSDAWQAYLEELRDWPTTVQIIVDQTDASLVKEPALPTLYAGLANQRILVELHRKRDSGMPDYADLDVNLSASRDITLRYNEGRPRLILLNLAYLPEGTHKYTLAIVNQTGRLLGKLPLEITAVPTGYLSVELVDSEKNSLTPARVGVYTQAIGFLRPSNVIPLFISESEVFYRNTVDPTWPSPHKRVFYTTGEFEMAVPSGPCRLIIRKGIEYLLYDETINIQAGERVKRKISMERWINLPEQGWYSSDDHVHIGRNGLNNEPILQLAQAEDVHVAQMLQMGDIDRIYFLQYAWGDEGMVVDGDYVLRSGQEDPRTRFRGHVIMLNPTNGIHDRETYYIYEDVFDTTHRMGGMAGYAHYGILLNAERGLSIDVPLGKVDFMELIQFHQLRTDVMYHFWNMGFRIIPTAGSDFPVSNSLLGDARFFVHVDGPFSYADWYRGLQAGHTFVSDGPVLEFIVDGMLPGSEINLIGPNKLRVQAVARINPTLDQLERLEIVQMGEVIKTVTADENGQIPLQIQMDLDVSQSAWIAARAFGKRTKAHTAPVYLVVDGKRILNKHELPKALERVEEKLREIEEGMVSKDAHPILQSNAPRLGELIKRARKVYRDIEKQAQ